MISAPRKVCNAQLVKIQSEQRLAASSELNSAPGLVTNRREARGKGYRVVTQVKGLSPEILVSEADTVIQGAGSIPVAVMVDRGRSKRARSWKRRIQPRQNLNSSNRRGNRKPAGSETTTRYQKGIAGTRETHNALVRVWDDKPINGKLFQKALWESDKPIVVRKRGNSCGAKGLTREGRALKTKVRDYGLRVKSRYIEGEEALLKSRMRENLKSGSVRGLMVSPLNYIHRRWP